MAKQEEEGKNKTVLIAVDGSEHSDRAFDCEYENGFVTRLTKVRSAHIHNQFSTLILHGNYQGISSKSSNVVAFNYSEKICL